MRPELEIADIFRRHGPAWRAAQAGHVSLAQLKVMSAIETCRTAALGGHIEGCEDCAHTRIAYNSCRNVRASAAFGCRPTPTHSISEGRHPKTFTNSVTGR